MMKDTKLFKKILQKIKKKKKNKSRIYDTV